MAAPFSDSELRRVALAGLGPEIEALGQTTHRADGVVAAVSAATPDRSIFNSVTCADPRSLAAELDALAEIYAQAAVRAWTVWVPDDDMEARTLLAGRGHVFDGAPRLMALPLTERQPFPALPDGYELRPGDAATLAALNDLAYGIEGPGWTAGFAGRAPDRLEILLAVRDGVPAACVGTIDVEGDLVITAVATDPAHQGRRLCSALLGLAIDQGAVRGMATSSLQASKAGAGVYERLGYRDVGAVELWEHRAAASG